ncbi:MAG TPA: hypothetical protein VHH92_03285 [Actinomycetota bacterium]|nr:hypothetical protein [Actinomycetota bacterium]
MADSPQPADARSQVTERREEPAATGILLAVAAAIAAGIGGWSSVVADRGSDTWHAAVRQDVKEVAGAVEDVRFVFEEEAITALHVLEARVLAEEYRDAARRATGSVREALLVEAAAQEQAAGVMAEGSELAGDPRYERPDAGGYDLALRLADQRRRFPDLIALDPDATQAEGSRLSAKATLLLLWTIPVAVAFLCGALVYGIPRWGRALVGVGFGFVAVGVIGAIVVGVTV